MSETTALSTAQENALHNLLTALIDQQQAEILVQPKANASGYWFGGGNLVEDHSGTIWLCGRYRNAGDSRTGLGKGERGLECAILKSSDGGENFDNVLTFSKADLSRPEREVISIEGTALHYLPDGTVELFISSEKRIDYPADVAQLQKPTTGVWTIDRITGPSPDKLDITTLETVLENLEYPTYLHVKDPVVYDTPDGNTALIFCSHPFSWSSSNSGLALRQPGQNSFKVVAWEVVSRGATWDVAATRITDRMPIPNVGHFADLPNAAVFFYDGAESLRQLDENPLAKSRPRGYSCEEIGGALFGSIHPTPDMLRLSLLSPMFISHSGTGSSRYAGTLVTERGILATWEQSQPDQSQPLVGHFLPMNTVLDLLS